jgi:DNA-binding response OmpR family regulator
MSSPLILAVENRAIRSALALILDQRLRLVTAATAANLDELKAAIDCIQPELLILSWDLPGLHVGGGLPSLRILDTGMRIVVLSPRAEDRRAALATGADGFVCMAAPPEDLLKAIQSGLRNADIASAKSQTASSSG